MGLNVVQIADKVRTEADAYLFMENLRWPDGEPTCPHCGNLGASYIRPLNGASRKTRTGAMSERRVWRCFTCDKQFSVLTGTVFHGTRIPLRKWVLVIFEMCASKNGVAAREIERKYGVCPRTAWFMMHRIREAMATGPLAPVFRGTVVADETYIGGDSGNQHRQGIRRRPSGEHARDHVKPKTPVLTLVNKTTGEARSRIMAKVTRDTLAKAIVEQVDTGSSVLHTDSLTAYRRLGTEFLSHGWVDHSAKEYVRGDVSTNQCENYFSQLKRSIDGTFHRISVEHLPRYLAEFDYRFSTRKLSDEERMAALMGRIGGKRLTYQRVAG